MTRVKWYHFKVLRTISIPDLADRQKLLFSIHEISRGWFNTAKLPTDRTYLSKLTHPNPNQMWTRLIFFWIFLENLECWWIFTLPSETFCKSRLEYLAKTVLNRGYGKPEWLLLTSSVYVVVYSRWIYMLGLLWYFK